MLEKSEFRHLGQKPTSKETVILMFADALEGACRARFFEWGCGWRKNS